MPEFTDDELRDIWRAHGGDFHGPNVETGTMPEENLLPFLRGVFSGAFGFQPPKGKLRVMTVPVCARCKSSTHHVSDCPE